MIDKDIPQKANSLLNWILVLFLLIILRVGFLATVKHEHHLDMARRPQRKTLSEPPQRGTVCDRFGDPLAINKVHYAAMVRYDPIRSIPHARFKKNLVGKKEKVFLRKKYIEELSHFLASHLNMDSSYIEDMIHSKASIFPNTPLILKEGLSENTYYLLKFAEKEWPGLEMQIGYRRYYPHGKLASHILGYMGAIDQRQFSSIAEELQRLSEYLSDREDGLPAPLPKGYESAAEAKLRYLELKEKSYGLNDYVGKSGIEKVFDEALRGQRGQKIFEVDTKGRVKRELPGGFPSVPGERILLNISSELQSFAEKLLIENETIRDKNFSKAGQVAPPWIKGGAIIAMLPKTGEIVAMASYPRFDPNDFVTAASPEEKAQKQGRLLKWLENEQFVSQVWEGKKELEKEILSKEGKIVLEKKSLSWDRFLEAVLSPSSKTLQAARNIKTVQKAIFLLSGVEMLQKLAGSPTVGQLIDALYLNAKGHEPSCLKTSNETKAAIAEALTENAKLAEELIEGISKFFPDVKHNDDKLLLLDLCRVALDHRRFPEPLLQKLAPLSLSLYRKETQVFCVIEEQVRESAEKRFYETDFKRWREEHFQSYLTQKRKKEKEEGRYQKPYLDYLQKKQKKLFLRYWQQNRLDLIERFLFDEKASSAEKTFLKERISQLSKSHLRMYLATMRSYGELNRPLWGRYIFFKPTGQAQLEKHLASAFYPPSGYGHCKSHSYEQIAPIGSIFKVVTAYEALRQHYLRQSAQGIPPAQTFNPLTIYDTPLPGTKEKEILGFTEEKIPIPRYYKGGRLPRTLKSLGKINLLDAMEQSSNLYFALLAADVLDQPTDLNEAAQIFGFGKKTGVALTGEYGGMLPKDLRNNLTGLYAFSIGQHSLVGTPLQVSQFMSAIANSGVLLRPQIVHLIAGHRRNFEEIRGKSYPYKETLAAVGIYFPFFHKFKPYEPESHFTAFPQEVQNSIFLPPPIRHTLLESMRRVTSGSKGSAQGIRIQYLYGNSKLMRSYLKLQKQMVGKTSTAEVLYKPSLDRETKAVMSKHIWFAGCSFSSLGETESLSPKLAWSEPELVVTVYLRYGDYGKEAAPLAAQIIEKWREICQKN